LRDSSPARPSRNRLGRDFGLPAAPGWANSGPSAGRWMLAVGSNPTAALHFRRLKTAGFIGAPKTLGSFGSSPPNFHESRLSGDGGSRR